MLQKDLQFSLEGAGEERGRERVHLLLRRTQPHFKLVGQGAERFRNILSSLHHAVNDRHSK